jgi:hypothetical protein
MNNDFPPFELLTPQIADRRKDRGRNIPSDMDLINRRQDVAKKLYDLVAPLSDSLRSMSEEERKAVFYKIEHEKNISLSGTDLKPIAEPSKLFTLAVPRSDNLDNFIAKINEFGYGNLKKGRPSNERLIAALIDIVEGSPFDRLSQALFEQYDQLIKEAWLICEIEMMSFAIGANQQLTELREIRDKLTHAFESGINGNFFEHEEIKGTCRAVIRCSGKLFHELVEGKEWQRRISWFDARPEFETFSSILNEFNVSELASISEPDDGSSIVCIVDSGVTIGNPFLTPVTKADFIKSFLNKDPNNPFDEYGHGSGVASLASYYALNLDKGALNEGKVWIASARILDADNQGEDDRLLSRVLEEVVETFVPLGVRIYNLSVNIINRKWNDESKRTVSRRSWIARTIDRISREKDIVFVVSTGNLNLFDVKNYIQDGSDYPAYLSDDNAKMLDPAQSALALTVGSIAPNTMAVGPAGSAYAIAQKNQPSPFTRCGPGVSREIKPELVEYGGNYLRDDSLAPIIRINPGTNVVMASNKLTPAIMHDCGTSFCVPRVTYKLARILDDLQLLGFENISAPLLKAFIVNSACYSCLGDEHSNFVEQMESIKPKHWLNVIGYGFPDHIRATDCDNNSVILFYQGLLPANKVAYFDIPVPAILASADNGVKRLTITVTCAPEVQRWGLEQYLGTMIKWRLFRGDRNQEDIIAAMSIETDIMGEEQPDIPGELKCKIGINLRSRGTIQHDIYEWSHHNADYSSGHYTLAIASYEKWGRDNPDKMPFAIVVRLEDTTHSADIYNEVKNILIQTEIQPQLGSM